MEQITKATEKYCTIISMKLHNILADNGIEAEKTDINNNDPTKIVWKYKPSKKLFEILAEYVAESHKKKENSVDK